MMATNMLDQGCDGGLGGAFMSVGILPVIVFIARSSARLANEVRR